MNEMLANAIKPKFEICNPYAVPMSGEQHTVYITCLDGNSVSVDACAGSGKSHTARAIGKNYDGTVHTIPFMVELRKAEEAAYAGFKNVNCVNFHARGMRMMNATLDNTKLKKIAFEIDNENCAAIANLAKYGKVEGVGYYANALSWEDICIKYGIKSEFIEKAIECLAKSDKITNFVDYEDMLRMPVVLGRREILSGLIILDEVQDYTPLAWQFLKSCLLLPTSHVLMIGDPSRQLLMAFAGASESLFTEMSKYFGCVKLELTVNRRCAKVIVDNAPYRGSMVALPDAPEGEIGTRDLQDVLAGIENGHDVHNAILSEGNAPLVRLGLNLITKGVKIQMRIDKLEKTIWRYAGTLLDLRNCNLGNIARMMRREYAEAMEESGEMDQDWQDVIEAVEALENYCLAKQILKNAWTRANGKPRPVHPVYQALNKLAGNGEGVTLLTGHTSKGLEWNTVYHLPKSLKAATQGWQIKQNECLAHVIATRSKLNLYTLTNLPKDDSPEDNEE